MDVQISIVQKNRDELYQQTIRSIRQSSVERDGTARGEVTVDGPTREAREALANFRQKLERGAGIDFGILVLLGFTRDEIRGLRAEGERSQIEITCSNLSWDYGDALAPLADMSSTLNFGDETHIGEALRKSWLRGRLRKQGICIRPINADEQEFVAYLSLRYKIYKEEKYIPLEHDSEATGLEISYSDRWSFPLGAFSDDGRIIGCIRLVEEYGQENQYKNIIERIVLGRQDKALGKAWELRNLPYPFDLCQYFDQFEKYYYKLVREGVNKAEISRVIVLPQYRRRGLGEVLVDTMISMARGRNIELLFLACKEIHRAFYERSGFRQIPDFVCEHFGQYGVRAITMERRL